MLTLSCRGRDVLLPVGVTYAEAAAAFQDLYDGEILLAYSLKRKRVMELFQEIKTTEKEVEFLTYRDTDGTNAYQRTAAFLLKKAVTEVLGPECRISVEFNLGGNYYVRLTGKRPTEKIAGQLKEHMRADAALSIPIRRVYLSAFDAVQMLEHTGEYGLARSIHYSENSRFSFYTMAGLYCYFSDHLCSSTGVIRNFDLCCFEGGLLLVLPKRDDFRELNPVLPAGPHFRTQLEGQNWADRLGINSLTDFNERIVNGSAGDVILMQEAFFEKRLGDVAETVIRKKKKFILLAGPSSSGKTTTAYRLAIQLRAFGVEPKIISADDYFYPAQQRPRLPDGTPDMESVRALDTELFNADMLRLLNGEEAELPTFNFVLQERQYKGRKLRLGPKTVLIVEGIHCLNPVFSAKIPEDRKMKLYVSSMNPLCVDDMNPIHHSDVRLLRRIVRDHRTRGYSAAETIAVWGSVRRGEDENIFPFQDEADVSVNSAMIYELSVLRPYVEPLLFGIGPDRREYTEARRLLKFLSFVLALPADLIPQTSLIREFIGGSCIE